MAAKSTHRKREEGDSPAKQRPLIDLGEGAKTRAVSPVRKIVDSVSFTVYKGALSDAPQSLKKDAKPPIAQPFVKWAGGKRNLMNSIKPLLPETFNNYYEGFVGGGALFFAIIDRITNAYLSDNNLDLVVTYQEIKKDPTLLIERLRRYDDGHSPDQYQRVREAATPQDPVEMAARFIYLNKTCFNGLWRVNKSGKFNVPMGDYKNPKIVDEENLMACHKALQKATIEFHPYQRIDPRPRAGDFCYFDPPYQPTTEDSFTAYTKENFTERNQSELRDFAVDLHRAGVKVMLSNSKTKFIENLYSAKGLDKIFRLHIVRAPRTVNCKPNARGAVDEYLITNY